MVDRGDLDPADWLSSQFGEDPPAPRASQPPPAPVAPAVLPPAPVAAPVLPPAPVAPPVSDPEVGGFMWGLTPGATLGSTTVPTTGVPSTTDAPPIWDSAPPAAVAPPAPPPFWNSAPAAKELPTQTFSFDSPIAATGAPPPQAPVIPPAAPIEAASPAWPVIPAAGWDTSTQPNSYDTPTQAISYPAPTDAPTQAFPGQALAPAWQPEPSPGSWLAAPFDSALDGLTDVVEAELVGSTAPVGEGRDASAIDDLFGASQFKDFSDEPFIAPPPPRQPGGTVAGAPKPVRAPIPRNQKILMWIAGGLVAALALVALFALGTKLSGVVAGPPVLPTPTPSDTTPAVPTIGPVAPGEHTWDALLGGECLAPYQSAWQDSYVVVVCTTPHPAQMIFRGTFADLASATYPGIVELQKRIPALCTAATVINYTVAGAATDIQITASFAVDETDWDSGNRTFFCFATRAAGAMFTGSIAVAQKPVSPTPTPTP